MRSHGIAVAALQLLALGSAQEHQIFKNNPRANLAVDNVRRQSPPPGYHPEFGACGSGTTCEDACGPNWISCQASTDLSLFCYNEVDLKQTCCENGSGRACEEGYYCAWQEFGGKVWCCENGQSLEECGLPQSGISTMTSTSTSSGGPGPSSSTSGPSTSGETSGTATGSETLSPTNSQCPAPTVTSWATTTVVSTVSLATATVTVTEGGGCSSSAPSSPGEPSHATSTTGTGTITQPPSSSSTFTRPPITNTTTSTIVTAGAGDLAMSPLLLVVLLLPATLLSF